MCVGKESLKKWQNMRLYNPIQTVFVSIELGKNVSISISKLSSVN